MFLFQEALAHKKAQDTATSMADAIIIFKGLRFLAHTVHTVLVIEIELNLVHSLNSAKQKVFNLDNKIPSAPVSDTHNYSRKPWVATNFIYEAMQIFAKVNF
jgi:hypothetical protein